MFSIVDVGVFMPLRGCVGVGGFIVGKFFHVLGVFMPPRGCVVVGG